MANLFDYLKWRGDLSLQQAGLNEVDSLILSRLSYLPLTALFPRVSPEKSQLQKPGSCFLPRLTPRRD